MARHIVDTLPKILPVTHNWKLTLLQNWDSVIGSLKDKVSLYRVADDHVVLTVCHPSLAQELVYLADVIREKINAAIGENRIEKLHFRTKAHTTRRAPMRKQEKSHETEAPRRNIRFTPKEKKALTKIDNQELRGALSAFYTTCKRRRATSS